MSPISLWISKFDVKFQNLMSSWGSWSKISKLQLVGDFSFFWSKSSLLVSKLSFNFFYSFRVHRWCINVSISNNQCRSNHMIRGSNHRFEDSWGFRVRFVIRFGLFGNLRFDSRFDSVLLEFQIRFEIRFGLFRIFWFDPRFVIRTPPVKNYDSIRDSTFSVLDFVIRLKIRFAPNRWQDLA